MPYGAAALPMTLTGPGPIPEETQRFILLAIPSVPYLEALLLLRGAPQLSWDAEQVARRLYLNEKGAQGLLDQLYAAGVVSADGSSFCYAPQSEQMRSMIDGLAEIYSRNLIGVSNLIHSKANTKAQQFADAFVFRKPPENN
ncbi:hypothetical protein ACFSQU_14935 [Massilia sp. GCM10020059]|uniref:Transcriptional regulator n=1 Tax=Massilia agrisoli TaxID=2892444 RepID=A0ABS8IQD6_9BURK|nr:hypothetical protein [Massilia agrisoli]MCC6070829.1 hypothetical protein [Massilia agrisoli]